MREEAFHRVDDPRGGNETVAVGVHPVEAAVCARGVVIDVGIARERIAMQMPALKVVVSTVNKTYDIVVGGGVEAVAQNDVHIGGIGVEIAVPKHSLYPSDSPRLVVAPFEAVGEIICEKVKVEVALGGDEAQGRGFRTGEDTRREAYQIPTAVGAFAIARDVLLDGRIDIAVAFQLPAVLDGEGVAADDGEPWGTVALAKR